MHIDFKIFETENSTYALEKKNYFILFFIK